MLFKIQVSLPLIYKKIIGGLNFIIFRYCIQLFLNFLRVYISAIGTELRVSKRRIVLSRTATTYC